MILYNNTDPFSNQPIPFIGRVKNNIFEGERWGASETWTLVGQLTGCSFENLTQAQNQLISGFSSDYGNLEIMGTGGLVAQAKYAEVASIAFPPSRFVGILPYTITLNCFPENYFSSRYGILNPVDKWEAAENKGRIISLTHTISANGFNTTSLDSNAYENARNFVLGRTGLSNAPAFEFIQNYRSGILVSQQENPNRIDGSYGLVQTYSVDQFGQDRPDSIVRYTVEQQSPEFGFSSFSINGTIQGGLNTSIETLRSGLNSFDFYSNLLYSLDSGVNLNPNPLNKQIFEDESRNLISFKFSYNDDQSFETNLDYTVSIKSGDGLITASINGNVNGKGDLKDRWEKAKIFFETRFRPQRFNFVHSGFSDYLISNGGTVELNPREINSSVSYDQFNGSISFSYEYSDSPVPIGLGIESLDYSITWTSPIRKISAEQLIYQRGYEFTDLQTISLGSFSIQGNGFLQRDAGGGGKSVAKNMVDIISSDYSPSSLIQIEENYDIGTAGSFSFGSTWKYIGADVLGPGNYSAIINL